MTTDLVQVGLGLQVVLILAALAVLGAVTMGARTLNAALALLALSFVGMAIRGEHSALFAVATGVLMELRLIPRLRHKGLLEWLLVALGLCQVTLLMTHEQYTVDFWIAQGLGIAVIGFAVVAAFAPHLWRPAATLGNPGFVPPNRRV